MSSRIDEEYIFESADAGCAGRCLEMMKKALSPSWLKLQLRSKLGTAGGYDVVVFWDYKVHGEPQPGPRATFDAELRCAKAFAAGFKAGMGAR